LISKAKASSVLTFNSSFIEHDTGASLEFAIKMSGTGFSQAEKHLIDRGDKILIEDNSDDPKLEIAQKIGIARKLVNY
jgi:hypothetical protein